MSSSKAHPRLPVLAGVLCGFAVLAGCVDDPHPELATRARSLLPTEQYGVKVTSRPEEIALGVHREGLSANQKAALAQFVSQWREDGGGAVTLRAPNDAPDVGAARRMLDGVAAEVTRLGVPAEKVRLTGYLSNRAPGAPVVASYDRFEALAPNCSGGWANLDSRNSNAPYDHFGCAVTANIATQIANPRDLLAPAVMTPADDTRREIVLGKYRQGQVTSTAADDQASGRSTSGSQ